MKPENIDVLEERLADLDSQIRSTRRLLDRVRASEALDREIAVLAPNARDAIARSLDARAAEIRGRFEAFAAVVLADKRIDRMDPAESAG
jgi:dihydropteroate synthase